jgi:serine/threonine protein kinase
MCIDSGYNCMLLKWYSPERRLDEIMKSKRSSVHMDLRLSIIRRLALAVLDYHSSAVTHGNICPSRVFLDDSSAPRLRFPGSQTCNLAGKLCWSAPECVAGLESTPSSDVFSLAVLGWAILMWKTPYKGQSEASVRAALAATSAAWQPLQLFPAPFRLPAGISELLDLCFSHDPRQRPEIAEVVNALAKIDRTSRLSHPLSLFPPSFVCTSLSILHAIRRALPVSQQISAITQEIYSATGVLSQAAARLLMTQRGLSFDEAASIFLYSTNLIYAKFTSAIRSLDAEQTSPWQDYAFILKTALEKLETLPPTSTYPGENVAEYFIV